MGEANLYYFTCLNFKRVKFWLNRHNDALFPRSRESRQVGQGAWRQLARPLQEHARSRKSYQRNGAQTRHQVPQECLREERDYSFQTLRWRPRSPRSGQSLNASGSQGRWPKKSAEFFLSLLKNAESNADYKGLDVDHLVVDHVQVNRAAQMRRRTYRAHGRINAYMSSPCHIEVILTEKDDVKVKGATDDDEPAKKKQSTKKLKRQKMKEQRDGGM